MFLSVFFGLIFLLGLCALFPFARMCFRLISLQFDAHSRCWDGGSLSDDPRIVGACLVLNVFWFLLGGWLMAIIHLCLIAASVFSIVGYKNAGCHWNLFKLCVAPFGRHICAVDAPFVSRMTFWELANYKPGRIYFGLPYSNLQRDISPLPPACAQQFSPYAPAAYVPQQASPMYTPPQVQQQQHIEYAYPIHPPASAPRMSEIE
jgi:uncharacterized membrane protein YccF (DUF307 family)